MVTAKDKILVIDDQPSVRFGLRRLLEGDGYRVLADPVLSAKTLRLANSAYFRSSRSFSTNAIMRCKSPLISAFSCSLNFNRARFARLSISASFTSMQTKIKNCPVGAAFYDERLKIYRAPATGTGV